MKTKAPAPVKTSKAPRRRHAPIETVEAEQDIEEASEVVLPDMAELEIEERLGVFHEKFGDKDYKVRVELFNKEDNEFEIVDTLKLDGFDPFSSIKKYGGGRYRLSLLDDGGKYVAGGRMEVRIAKVAGEASQAPTPAPDNGTSAIMSMLQAQNAQNLEMIKALIGRPVAENKGPSLTELITAMNGLRALAPKEANELGGVKGTLELMKLVKELLPEPAEAGGEGLMGELSQAVELFGKVQPMIAARRAERTPPKQVQTPDVPVNLTPGTVVAPQAEPQQEPENPMKPVLDKALSYVPQLTAWASRGKDIEEAADFVLDEIENEIVPAIIANYRPGGIVLSREVVWNQLISKAQDPAQVAAIFTAIPALAPYRKWFESVLASAVDIALHPEGDDEPESTPPNDGQAHG